MLKEERSAGNRIPMLTPNPFETEFKNSRENSRIKLFVRAPYQHGSKGSPYTRPLGRARCGGRRLHYSL